VYTLGDALSVASWLNVFVRSPDVAIACIAQVSQFLLTGTFSTRDADKKSALTDGQRDQPFDDVVEWPSAPDNLLPAPAVRAIHAWRQPRRFWWVQQILAFL